MSEAVEAVKCNGKNPDFEVRGCSFHSYYLILALCNFSRPQWYHLENGGSVSIWSTENAMEVSLFPSPVFNLCHFNYDMSSFGSVWVHLAWDPPWFLYLYISFLLQVFRYNSSNTFLITFSLCETSIMWISVCLMFFYKSLQLFLFVCFFFPFWGWFPSFCIPNYFLPSFVSDCYSLLVLFISFI